MQEKEQRQQEVEHLEEQRRYHEDVERNEILGEQIARLKYQRQLDEQLRIKDEEKIRIY